MSKTKEERAAYAAEHLEQMKEQYAAEIEESLADTIIYGGDGMEITPRTPSLKNTDITVLGVDVVAVAMFFARQGQKTCILDFADYTRPAGSWLKGTHGQEDCLCDESTLPNILLSEKVAHYYDWNKANMNGGLYEDRALYIPGVVFESRNEVQKMDVLVCAAPDVLNSSGETRKKSASPVKAMNDRIKFIVDIMAANGVQQAILGAYGCGARSNSIRETSRAFVKALKNSGIDTAVFAITPNTVREPFEKGLGHKS